MKYLDMMIVETWAHYFGVAPLNLCVTVPKLPYFLLPGKIDNYIWKVRAITKKFASTKVLGTKVLGKAISPEGIAEGRYRREAFIC